MNTVRLNLPTQSPGLLRILALGLLLSLTLPACGMFEHEYDQPPRAFEESKDPGGSTPPPTATAAEYVEPAISSNEVIVDCERHIRSWQFAQSQVKTQRDRLQLEVIEQAFAIYVRQEIQILREVAMTGDERSRGIASTALGFSLEASVMPILLNNLGDESDLVIANTLYGLGILASPETPAGPMRAAIQRPGVDTDLVRNGTFAAIRIAKARRDDPGRGQRQDGLLELLIYLIDRPEPNVRAQAATGLGYLQAADSLPDLANLLAGDPESQVRFAAAFALGEIGAKNAAPGLISALDDPDRLTVGAARGALAKIFGRDYGPDPKAWNALID